MKNQPAKVICHDVHGKLYEVSVDQLSFRPSVYAVIIQDGRVLLSKQWDGYDFPGGGLHLGETIEQGLIREVKEETGLEVRVCDLISIGDSFFKMSVNGDYVQALVIYYTGEIVGGEISTMFLSEHEKQYVSQAEWVDLKNLSRVKFYNSIDNQQLIAKATNTVLKK